MKYFRIILLLISTQGVAQLVNDGNVISISENTVMSIGANVLNTGKIVNDGTLFIQGNWTNLGNYVDEQGQLLFNGSGDQFINNNDQNLNDLQIVGGGRKIISDNAKITGNLTFNAGKLVVSPDVIFTLGETSKIIGANENNYIVGKVFAEPKDSIAFPIGTANKYLPVWLTQVYAENSLIGVEVKVGDSSDGLGKSLEAISSQYYWELDTDAGYQGGFITLPYENEPFLEDTSRLVIAQLASPASNYKSLAKSFIDGDETSGFVTSSGIAIGQKFTIGYSSLKVKLPSIRVINVLTPYADGKHDYLRIENIEMYENNIVEIYNRNGEKVFTISNYNNRDRIFIGMANVGPGGRLNDGNYFYIIRKELEQLASGFIFIKS